jgi:hypothetical protein
MATTMSSLFVALFALVVSSFRTRAALQAEILALRHQLAVCQKNAPRRLRWEDNDAQLFAQSRTLRIRQTYSLGFSNGK